MILTATKLKEAPRNYTGAIVSHSYNTDDYQRFWTVQISGSHKIPQTVHQNWHNVNATQQTNCT